ncbi:MAG: hypothetical protein KGJ86_08305, partial [Chloroflexota bacterium]|nr:hypothetical protein [Chloroflexota bacterium]
MRPQLKPTPIRRAVREDAEPALHLADSLAQEIGGIAVLAAAGLTLISIFPADSLLAQTLGPAILRTIGPVGGFLLALGLAAVGVGLIWQAISEERKLGWHRGVGYLLLLSTACAFSQMAAVQGGSYGEAIAHGLRYLIGPAGAILLLLGVLVAGVILTFRVSLAWLYDNILFLAGRTRTGIADAAAGLKGRTAPPKPIIEINAGDDDAPSAKILKFPKAAPAPATDKPAITVEAPQDEEPAVTTIVTRLDFDWQLPPLDILEGSTQYSATPDDLERKAQVIVDTLASFGVDAAVKEIKSGPAITRFGLLPAEGVKVSRITSLADDLALRLAAHSIRVQAPVPGYGMV